VTIRELSTRGYIVLAVFVASLASGLVALLTGAGVFLAGIFAVPGVILGAQVVLPAVWQRFNDDAWIARLLDAHAIATAAGNTRVAGACHRKIVMATDKRPDLDWSLLHAKIDHGSTSCSTCVDFSWVREDTL